MDVQMVLNLIGTLGFPVAVCVILLWYVFRLMDAHKVEVKELTKMHEKQVQELIDKHQQECKELSTALNNNTIVMTQLLEQMRKE